MLLLLKRQVKINCQRMGPKELNNLSEKRPKELLWCHQTVVHSRPAKSSLVPLNSTAVMCTLLLSGTGPC